MIAHARLHCRGDAQGLMDAAEVVIYEMQGHRVGVVLGFLGKAVRQPGEAARGCK